MILTPLFGAGGPPPTTVQGVVEVINDVLYQPFNVTTSIGTTQANSTVSFDVPARQAPR